jgi:hypothetical protein
VVAGKQSISVLEWNMSKVTTLLTSQLRCFYVASKK